MSSNKATVKSMVDVKRASILASRENSVKHLVHAIYQEELTAQPFCKNSVQSTVYNDQFN